MLSWPPIQDLETKSLQQVALELCIWCVQSGIRESGGANRGPEVDDYARAVGLDPVGAWPWCTDAMYCVFREAARLKGMTNPFPKTAKAVSVWNLADKACRASNPKPGSVGVLDHGKAWASELGTRNRLTDNGHIVIANAAVNGDISGNTNLAGSREGNAWGEHLWPDGGDPAAVHGGIVIGWLDFDLAFQQPPSTA
jgi:hypothetical protein